MVRIELQNKQMEAAVIIAKIDFVKP